MSSSIAYLAAAFPARSETFVYREVRALRRRGWDVYAVSLNPPADAAEPGFADLVAGSAIVYAPRWALRAAGEIIRHPVRAARTLARAFRDAVLPGEPTSAANRLKLVAQAAAGVSLAGRLRRAGVSHVHAHFAHAPASVGMYAAGHLGVPFSFTGHANDLFQRRTLLGRKLRRAAFVSCISEWHREFYRTIEPSAGGRLRVIRCGVDTAGWTPTPKESAPGGTFRVLTVCRLVEKKGVDTLLHALAALDATRQPWELTIAGDGPDRRRLGSLAGELGVAGRVRWLGPVRNERVPELLAASDVFALPCRTDSGGDRDGIPVVLMEAMACGIAVVGGDLPAIRELIEDGTSGRLIDGTNVAALTNVLSQLAADPAERERLSRGGRARVEAEFGLDANVSRMEDALGSARRTRTGP